MNMRKATTADWPRIIDIYNQAVEETFCTADTEPATLESRHTWLEQHLGDRYPIFVAELDGQPVGWCSLSPWRAGRKALHGTAEVSYYFDRAARGRGIASQLMEHTIEQARSRDIQHLLAILMDVNQASIGLLQKFKFERWGHLPDIARFDEGKCGQLIYGRKI